MASQQQTKLIKRWQDDGYIVVNLINTNLNGIPDLMALKDGETVFIESKEKHDTLKPLQKYVIKRLIRAGFDCYVNDEKVHIDE